MDTHPQATAGPYSLTAVPALEVKPPIARKLRKMAIALWFRTSRDDI